MRYPRVIAHRGGGCLAPENTLAGLRVAARLGCQGVEFDVMLSGDGVPVLMHDETLERTTDGAGPVAAQRFAELRALDAGIRHGAAFQGETIPALEEALALCAELGLWTNIEVKPSAGRDEETGSVVGRLLAACWQGDGVVSSFSASALAAARRAAPQFAFAVLADAIPAAWRERLAAGACQAWHCRADADAATIAAVAAAGIPLACYTVNRRDDAARLFAAGAAAVFTDRPDLWAPGEM
ncbi:MAG: glycerophosphodiester phosphodiesterase [Rhodocyclaceae bacterium]|nr:glycerophosphodiester phosphodiesterase [Rhodocyclaceae bacterium]